jgi:hypothetical protein
MSGATVLIDAPAGYEAERRYVLGEVLGDRLGLGWQLRTNARSDVRIALAGDETAGEIVLPDLLFGTEPRHWLTPASLPSRPIAWRPLGGPGPTERLPILYGPRPAPASLLREEGPAVHVGLDIFGSVFFMLTRYEELAVPSRDAFGRFPASASLARAEGLLALPVVDAYVDLLWAALRRRWPRLERPPASYRLALTHDVDRPLSFLGRGLGGFAKQLGADLLVRRDPRLMAQRVRSWAGIASGDHRLDPDNTFDFLMAVSERHGLASAFYFLATEEVSFIDGYYTLAHPWIRRLIATMHRRGHEIGLHAGIRTYRDADRTKAEFARLRAVALECGVRQDCWGGRQHYLRWENPATWANWEAAGLDYDSTLTFADHVGFRAGTCHEFHPFDLRERRRLRLRERPLIVMDATALEYMRISRDAAAAMALDLARQCRRHRGTLTLLWHNSRLQTARERRWYEALIEAVA